MEFKEFTVKNLFCLYDHKIDFSKSKTSDKGASIIMPVSYTHLDVYKRQHLISLTILTYEMTHFFADT